MFAEGIHSDLIFAAVVCFFAGLLILRPVLGSWLSLFLVLIRILIPTVYFAYFYQGEWTTLDDWTYYQQGRQFLETGANPFLVFFQSYAYEDLQAVSQSRHTLYILWNSIAQKCFGDYYFSAVFLNVVTTLFAARSLYRLAEWLGARPDYSKWLSVFFILHWDVLAWSSFLNVKDLLVMLLSLLLLFGILRLGDSTARLRAVLLILLCSSLMLILRYYIPVIVFAASLLWIILFLPGKGKFLLMPLVGVALYLFIPQASSVHWDMIRVGNTLSSLFRFLFTPRPWAITTSYSFLEIPSLLHWVCAPLTLLGGLRLWFGSRNARLLLIYLCTICFFYALVPTLSGPRHRLQVVFILAFMQYHAVAGLFIRGVVFRDRSEAKREAAVVAR